MSEAGKQAPLVSTNSVLAAGLASAVAATVTSRFGVAGTLLGAALTTMIITGGSAILKAYLENISGKVREVPSKVRARANREKAGRPAEQPTIPESPSLKDNFAGRLRSALDWFSHLPPLRRRSILLRALIGALIAFVIGLVAITSIEVGIGNSLSCGLWSNCPEGATPGIGGARVDKASKGHFSILGGRGKSGGRDQSVPLQQQQQPGFQQQDGQQVPGFDPGGANPQQGVPGQDAPGSGQQNPGRQNPVVPAQPGGTPGGADQQQPPSE